MIMYISSSVLAHPYRAQRQPKQPRLLLAVTVGLILLCLLATAASAAVATTPSMSGTAPALEAALATRVNRSFAYSVFVFSSAPPVVASCGGSCFPQGGRPLSLYTEAHQKVAVKLLEALERQLHPHNSVTSDTTTGSASLPTESQEREAHAAPTAVALLRVSAVSDCVCEAAATKRSGALCCPMYWVTDAFPPGLPLATVQDTMLFWDGFEAVNGYFANFSERGKACAGGENGSNTTCGSGAAFVLRVSGAWELVPEKAISHVLLEHAVPDVAVPIITERVAALKSEVANKVLEDAHLFAGSSSSSSRSGSENGEATPTNLSFNSITSGLAVIIICLLLVALLSVLFGMYMISYRPRTKQLAAYRQRFAGTSPHRNPSHDTAAVVASDSSSNDRGGGDSEEVATQCNVVDSVTQEDVEGDGAAAAGQDIEKMSPKTITPLSPAVLTSEEVVAMELVGRAKSDRADAAGQQCSSRCKRKGDAAAAVDDDRSLRDQAPPLVPPLTSFEVVEQEEASAEEEVEDEDDDTTGEEEDSSTAPPTDLDDSGNASTLEEPEGEAPAAEAEASPPLDLRDPSRNNDNAESYPPPDHEPPFLADNGSVANDGPVAELAEEEDLQACSATSSLSVSNLDDPEPREGEATTKESITPPLSVGTPSPSPAPTWETGCTRVSSTSTSPSPSPGVAGFVTPSASPTPPLPPTVAAPPPMDVTAFALPTVSMSNYHFPVNPTPLTQSGGPHNQRDHPTSPGTEASSSPSRPQAVPLSLLPEPTQQRQLMSSTTSRPSSSILKRDSLYRSSNGSATNRGSQAEGRTPSSCQRRSSVSFCDDPSIPQPHSRPLLPTRQKSFVQQQQMFFQQMQLQQQEQQQHMMMILSRKNSDARSGGYPQQ